MTRAARLLGFAALLLTACAKTAGTSASPQRAVGTVLPIAPSPPPRGAPLFPNTKWPGFGGYVLTIAPDTAILSGNAGGVIAIDKSTGKPRWRNRRVCEKADAAAVIGSNVYVGCVGGQIARLNSTNGNLLASSAVGMYGINAIVAAGARAIVVEGYNDGSHITMQAALLRSETLSPISSGDMTDNSFLGTIGDRAYFDDFCCNGRADTYLPATVYYIALSDGTESPKVDLTPDAQSPFGAAAACRPRIVELPNRQIFLRTGRAHYVPIRHHGPEESAGTDANALKPLLWR